MATFGITPVGVFPPASDDGFPRFLQWQQDGVDVGDTAVETINITGDVAVSVSSGGGTLTIDIGAVAPTFAWREIDGDSTIALSDVNNGITSTGNSGQQLLNIPAFADVPFDVGGAILIHQGGGAPVMVVAPGGVNLRYRFAAFNPTTAGEEAVMTLINFGVNDWILCGDLEAL